MAQINAVDEAIRGMNGIPFVEFTSSLINGVFETLVESQITQMRAFMEIFQAISAGMASYINATADDVDDAATLDFLQNLPAVANAPSTGGTQGQTAVNDVGTGLASLSGGTAGAVVSIAKGVLDVIRTRVDVPGITNALPPAATTDPVSVPVDHLKRAIAQRIAANRYGALENMMRMGLMRIVVDNGLLEARLTFNTFENHTDEQESRDRHKDRTRTRTLPGGPIGRMLGRNQRSVSRVVNVKQVKELHRDTSGTSVKFYSRVLLNFKTDYMPLGQ
jgi:hypothetical protein